MGYHGITWYLIVSQWINALFILLILLFCSYFVLKKLFNRFEITKI